MNRLSKEKQKMIIACLVEGNSIRATVRMTGAAKNTVTKLLCDIGKVCSEYQHKVLRDLPCQTIECDEIWSFCHTKEKNVPEEKKGVLGFGDVYTWTAICADTKIVPSWHVGRRDMATAKVFINDLALKSTIDYRRIQALSGGC